MERHFCSIGVNTPHPVGQETYTPIHRFKDKHDSSILTEIISSLWQGRQPPNESASTENNLSQGYALQENKCGEEMPS